MSNTTKNLKKRIKAPRELVYAAKKGERVTPRRKTDTRATHIRRFSKALVAYACAALVLVGGSLTLPALLDAPAPAPQSQPNGSVPQNVPAKPAATDSYVALSAAQAAHYIRPDLIWANELNPELKDTVIWEAEKVGAETSVTNELTLPDVGGEEAEYAVELRLERIGNGAERASATFIVRRMTQIESLLGDIGFETVDILPADRSAKSSCFAASRAELDALDTEELLSILSVADGDLRFKLQIAWQSLDGSQKPIVFGSDDDLDYTWKDSHIVEDYPIDSVKGELSVDISGLPTAPVGDEGEYEYCLNVAPSTLDDSKKATVVAKKVSSESYYSTAYATIEPEITPLAYTISYFEILSIEQDSDYYHSEPYQVGSTIRVIEWYAVCPAEESPTGEECIYRSYPYPCQGIEMPDLMEIGKTYRLSLVEGAALDVNDDIIVASCYESGTRRSALIYLYGCHLIASDVEVVG